MMTKSWQYVAGCSPFKTTRNIGTYCLSSSLKSSRLLFFFSFSLLFLADWKKKKKRNQTQQRTGILFLSVCLNQKQYSHVVCRLVRTEVGFPGAGCFWTGTQSETWACTVCLASHLLLPPLAGKTNNSILMLKPIKTGTWKHQDMAEKWTGGMYVVQLQNECILAWWVTWVSSNESNRLYIRWIKCLNILDPTFRDTWERF